MTFENLKIVLTNALCCSSELAVKVSDLLSKGNKCAEGELKKLKVLLDRIELLNEYYCEYSTNYIINGTFDEIDQLEGWTIDPITNWIWNSFNGGSISYEGIGGLFSQDILVKGKTYKLTFDLLYTDDEEDQLSDIIVHAGANEYPINIISDSLIRNIELIITTEDNITFAIEGNNIASDNRNYIIDNIILRPYYDPNIVCLTEEQIDDMIHEVMKTCEICDCQLTQ